MSITHIGIGAIWRQKKKEWSTSRSHCTSLMPTPCVEHTLSNSVDTSSEAASSLKEEEKKKKKISPFNRDNLLAEMSDAYGLCVLMTSFELERSGERGD